MAACQNSPFAQFLLAYIYLYGKYTKKDIKKAIKYLTLSVDQHFPMAFFLYGVLYFEGKYIKQDLKKSIHYLSIASNQNIIIASIYLGLIYFSKHNNMFDINKAIHYFTIGAQNNDKIAQRFIGKIYFFGYDIPRDIKKGIYYLTLSATNDDYISSFIIGFIYHEGYYLKQDIKKAISFYKKSSSYNYSYSKNNLGVIYKNGFKNEIEPNALMAVEYLNEAVRQKNDMVSKYNLSIIYIYDTNFSNYKNKVIELLIGSLKQGFKKSASLLAFYLIKEYGNDIKVIEKELHKYTQNIDESLNSAITYGISINKSSFDNKYKHFANKYYLYDHYRDYFPLKKLEKRQKKNNFDSRKNLTLDFYHGFGIDF